MSFAFSPTPVLLGFSDWVWPGAGFECLATSHSLVCELRVSIQEHSVLFYQNPNPLEPMGCSSHFFIEQLELLADCS